MLSPRLHRRNMERWTFFGINQLIGWIQRAVRQSREEDQHRRRETTGCGLAGSGRTTYSNNKCLCLFHIKKNALLLTLSILATGIIHDVWNSSKVSRRSCDQFYRKCPYKPRFEFATKPRLLHSLIRMTPFDCGSSSEVAAGFWP